MYAVREGRSVSLAGKLAMWLARRPTLGGQPENLKNRGPQKRGWSCVGREAGWQAAECGVSLCQVFAESAAPLSCGEQVAVVVSGKR